MAIIVEEPNNKKSGSSIMLGVVVVIAICAAAVYYIFFATVPAAIVTPPPNYASIGPIANINFNPTSVLGSHNFQALKPYVTEPTSTGPGQIGRSNPFSTP